MRRKAAEISYSLQAADELNTPLALSAAKTVFVAADSLKHIQEQQQAGYTVIKETPDSTLVFLTPSEWSEIQQQRARCVAGLAPTAAPEKFLTRAPIASIIL